ncbi:MAG TPA: hypothetical protein VG714_05535 [Acidobacteriaceae bacterium]|nr:hypothetical protein [Acidobacteriaceae bacterium]
MAQPLHASSTAASRSASTGALFGLPLGDLGWFGSLLIGVASGFLAFFATTFCAIVGILIWNSATHSNIDYADSYRRVGFPIGMIVLVCALGYLGTLWVRRMLRKA